MFCVHMYLPLSYQVQYVLCDLSGCHRNTAYVDPAAAILSAAYDTSGIGRACHGPIARAGWNRAESLKHVMGRAGPDRAENFQKIDRPGREKLNM